MNAPKTQWEPWVVWSYEHDAWWGPSYCGYHDDLMFAGIYPRVAAKEIETDANAIGERKESAMSLADAIAAEHLRRFGPHSREVTVGTYLRAILLAPWERAAP